MRLFTRFEPLCIARLEKNSVFLSFEGAHGRFVSWFCWCLLSEAFASAALQGDVLGTPLFIPKYLSRYVLQNILIHAYNT